MGSPGTFTITRPREITYILPSGLFLIGETITGGTSGATGTIIADTGTILTINLTSGTFLVAETITGGTSGTTATVSLFNEAFSDQIKTTQQGLRTSINWYLQSSGIPSASNRLFASMTAGIRGAGGAQSFISANNSRIALPVELGGIAPNINVENTLNWTSATGTLTLNPSTLLIQYLA
jgi:hypothetical protein